MELLARYELLSDAAHLAVIGALLWAIAGFAVVMERRRARYRDVSQLERVGWVPWTGLFLAAAMIGGGLLAMGLPAVIGGL